MSVSPPIMIEGPHVYNTVKMKGGKECENRVMIYVHDYDQYPKQVKITQHVYKCTVHGDALYV